MTAKDGVGADNFTNRMTLTGMSEFGCSLDENANRNTVHGYGDVLMAMGMMFMEPDQDLEMTI